MPEVKRKARTPQGNDDALQMGEERRRIKKPTIGLAVILEGMWINLIGHAP